MVSPTEAHLVLAAQRGDEGAFERLVIRHRDTVLRCCLTQSGDREAAEDLAQETFLRVWLHLHRLRYPYAFGAWARRIAMNLAQSRVRAEMRAAAHLQRDHAADLELVPDPAVASRAETSEAQTEIARAVSFLPESSRELIRLHFQEGHSKVEIAAQRGVHPSTVGRQLEKVIGELRGSLRSSSPKARRIVTLLATISSVSFATSASAAPAPVIATPGPLHVRVLTFFLEGLGIMGTTGKITAVATAAALIAGGVYLGTRKDLSTRPLSTTVAAQVSDARGTGKRPHPLGSESIFTLKAGEKLVLETGTNSYNLSDITVTRGSDDVSVQVAFGDGTTRVFKGSLTRGDFVMLGATNYVEDGSVEGTATAMPADMMTYLVWERHGAEAQFHLLTRVNPAFGKELMALQQNVQSARISNEQALREGERLLRTHQMYPTGDVYRNAGKGFVPSPTP